MKSTIKMLMAGSSLLLLAGCGAEDVASPGTSGNVTINNVTPAPTPAPTPTPTSTLVTAAADCPNIADPQGLANGGTITGPTGSYRVCRLPSLIRTSISLPKITGVVYEINGRVNVGCDGGFRAPTTAAPVSSSTIGCTTALTEDTNVTLTIAPGAVLFGGTGQSWLAVNRGNKINAVGTATQPIIFTSRANVEGTVDDTSQGQWGGVVLLGRGITTDCNAGTVAAGAANSCERDTEGSADLARFGGNDDSYNAGRMSYVQIRYSGFVLGAARELQALTLEAVGTGTVLDHIQLHNSSDDGTEWFGGAVNMKHLVVTGADDDSLDVDTGAQANLQYALLIQRAARGDALFEIDSNGLETDVRRTRLNVVNFVALQPQVSSDNESADLAAALFRGNSDNTLANGIIATPNNECLRLNGSGTTPVTFTARAVQMQCNAAKYLGSGTFNATSVAAAFGTGSNANNDAYTPSLTGQFVNGSTEDAVVAFAASALAAFFEVPSPNRIGAAWAGNNSWFTGWTCNSATAQLSGASACTTLPAG